MIFDNLSNLNRYEGLSANINTAIHFLQAVDLSTIPYGTTQIDGEQVFINHFTYETSTEKGVFESHNIYLDLQIVLSGTEEIHVTNISALQETTQLPDEDAILWDGEATNRVHMDTGNFLLLYPAEGHKPKVACGQPTKVDKMVVKIAL